MARPGKREQSSNSVEASLNYLVDTGEKLVRFSAAPGSSPVQEAGRYEERTVTIHDGRLIPNVPSLEREGFVFIDHETRVSDFYDEDEVRRVYYPEMERLVKDRFRPPAPNQIHPHDSDRWGLHRGRS